MITRLDSIPGNYDLYPDQDDQGRIIEGFDTLTTTNPLKSHNTVVFVSDDESEVYLIDLGPLPMNKRSSWPKIEDVVAKAADEFRNRP